MCLSYRYWLGFLHIASPQQGDLRLSGTLSGQSVGDEARTRDTEVPTDLRADALFTVPLMPLVTRNKDGGQCVVLAIALF
ncbi:hypothetical protein PoB_004274200 [Plakobranchus ocellatus]|uniref:Uncharacterized protein n=1 Tax=Plakobranchus ocellatus TaxID=259542 RepID=A0AAV4B9Z6_9GAST|nr:hypothetical protein PoB_004274200 [Plakobranchus ocellatus]